MGLDIYAGTLTRYYAHNWKTVVQQWAEKNGWGFQRVTPEGDAIAQEEELTPTEIQKAIEHWRDGILEALVPEGQPPFPAWTEDNETPYYTDKPDWDAFEALLLFGACRIYDMPVPEQFPKHGQFEQFEAAGRMQADENMNWSLFTGAVWWLPLEECFVVRAPLPTGDEAVLGTAGTLLAELKRINELSWQADEKEICAWSRAEGYPAEAEVGQGGVLTKQNIPAHTRFDTESLAKFAFSILYQAARFSLAQRVPVLLDY